MKLMEFSGHKMILGNEFEVAFTDHRLSIEKIVDVETALALLAVLAVVKPEQAQAALLAERNATMAATAAVVSASVAAAEQPAGGKKRRGAAETTAADPALATAPSVPAGVIKVVDATGAVIAHGTKADKPAKSDKPALAAVPPAADDLVEDDFDDLAGEMPSWQDVQVDDVMRTATKAAVVFRHLVTDLKMDVEGMVAFCKAHQAEIPSLAGKPEALDGRVRNAHRVLSAPATPAGVTA